MAYLSEEYTLGFNYQNLAHMSPAMFISPTLQVNLRRFESIQLWNGN